MLREEAIMPTETSQHGPDRPEDIGERLERLEALVQRLLNDLPAQRKDRLGQSSPGYVVFPSEGPPFFRDWLKGSFVFVPDIGGSHFEPVEMPAPPWKHLVARQHPWRKQLYVKGRNLTVRQLVGTVKANRLSPAEAARDLDLPIAAIEEALAYAAENEELLKLETEIEQLLLKRMKPRGPAPVPR
jgi:uncharacterized protein (DUF433 family)